MVVHITMKVSRPVTPKLSETAHNHSTQADKVCPEEYRQTMLIVAYWDCKLNKRVSLGVRNQDSHCGDGVGCLKCTRGDQSEPQRARLVRVTPGGTRV